jgi:hypothetical protein
LRRVSQGDAVLSIAVGLGCLNRRRGGQGLRF